MTAALNRFAIWPTLAIASALSLCAMPALAQDTTSTATLSLEEALQLARDNNPAYLQQRNDLGVAKWSVRSAYGALLPSASAGAGFGYTASGAPRFGSVEFERQPENYSSSYSLGLNYRLSGATLLQPSVERARAKATERRVVGTESQLVAQVTQQYLSTLQARAQVEQAIREVARTGEHVRLAEARFEVGAGTPLDVRRAEVQEGQAEVLLLQARNTLATSKLLLGQLMGKPLDPDVSLTSDFAIFDPSWQTQELVEMAIEANPTLLAARATSNAASTNVTSAKSSYLPSLNFSVGLQGSVYQAGSIDPLLNQRLAQISGSFGSCLDQNTIRTGAGLAPIPCLDPATPGLEADLRRQLEEANSGFPFDYTPQPLSASMSISLPIFTGFSRKLQVEQAEANAADARYQVRAEELRLNQAVSAEVLSLETAYQTVLLQEQVRQRAEEELRLAQERFRFGAASSVEVTDAQTNLSQAERDKIDALYDFHKSLAALEALVGQQLR
ncbi:MAG TPA: TolC family protein [Longimicrobiaceae bacterium]|nr:TolC family protein [Longimicrobiaceae bacterium]